MSSVHVTVQDSHQCLYAMIDEDLTHAIIGSLSADPETISELQAASTRFVHPDLASRLFSDWAVCHQPPQEAEPFCVIDLPARLLATSWQHDLDDGVSATPYVDSRGPSERWYPYHLSDCWLLTNDLRYWPTLSGQRHQQRMNEPRIDLRHILYGTPLMEFLVDQCHAATVTAAPPLSQDDTQQMLEDQFCPTNPVYRVARDLHARWLTLPQPLLQGRSVRDEMLIERSHIARDIDHRSHQWVGMKQCPPGLSEQDSAYRWGGLGTHEIIVYYDLVRFLLYHCLHRFVRATAGEPVSTEWLEELRDGWLNRPDPDHTGRMSPREIIERERRRLPLVEEPGEAIDCDCPLCRMMLESDAGPAFTYLGGFHLDDDFAFSFCRTETDWQQGTGESPFDDVLGWDDEWNENHRGHQPSAGIVMSGFRDGCPQADPTYSPVWESAFVNPEIVAEPPATRLFGIGTYLAEIISNLRHQPNSQVQIDALNQQFDNLCQANRNRQDELLQPVVDRFCEQLQEVAETWGDLTPKCFALQETLRLWFGEGDPLADSIDRFPRDWT